jgi:hypothetical protein
MSPTAVLLCSGTGLGVDAVAGPAVVIEDLCGNPSAGVAAMRGDLPGARARGDARNRLRPGA